MAGLKYREQYRIPYFEADATGEMTLSSMINVMVLVSDHQSDALGVGLAVMNAHDVGWVITQYHMNITRFPKVDEVVTVTTEATSYNKYFCYRHFWMHDSDGNELASVAGTFVMMSFKTRRMVKVIPEIIQAYQSDEINGVEKFPRIPHLDAKKSTGKNYRVRYFDIDSNRHVNNVHYFDWMLDALRRDFLLTHNVKTLDIRYEREIHYGETTQSQVEFADSLRTLHRIQTGDTTNAEAQIEWADRPEPEKVENE
ncbi:oleoyl-[acyl-carrier protein] thioesterase [Lactobacillus selangorensis]|uniref:Oleoyl-[acyl-carrier protein] thioesterase n=1 Tax=Lactobacillus selangorensis TaxID=81857 RepID=A0A0R2FFQ4_9LACO|nr:acyl-ACP thioesterase domain-containing protein [Lactobacillus selangorensis]KRN27423.1 oleoyl-[acyl-carrier protein] thioesterase [Lactobacillus selangorensis]KRN31380.1 oleoyl-[acyl-carrier protein] thioesterase [Lactobacillus selangorensis]